MPRVGWFTSSYSNAVGACVEVKFDTGAVLVRDTKYLRNPANDPAVEPIIALPAIKWKGFLEKVLDPAVEDVLGLPMIDRDPAGGATLRAVDGTTLGYTEREWTAFVNGVRDGEFALALA